MQFGRLRVANFGSIGELELPLADQGLALILGRNEDAPRADSNGAGKSLPLDAFTWALWGNTIRGFGSDEVVNKRVGKNCAVSVSFTDRGKEYEVTRYRANKADKDRKANDLILTCEGKDVSGASIAATQEAVEQVLGLDFTTFCAMMPGAGINVATMTDAQVKLILESILRTETLGKASEVARSRHRGAEQELQTLLVRLRDLNAVVEEQADRITSLEEKESTYADTRLIRVGNIRVAITQLEKEKAELDAVILDESNLTSQKGEVLVGVEGSEAEEKKLRDDHSRIDRHYGAKIRQLNEDRIALATRIEDLVKQKQKPSYINCPTCSQIITAQTKAAIQEGLRIQEDSLMTKVDTLEKSIALTHTAWEGEKDELDTFLGPATVEVATWHAELAKIEILLEKVADAKKSVAALQDKIASLSGTMMDLEADGNPFTSLLETERKKLQEKQDEQDTLIDGGLKLKNKVEVLKFWVDSFSPSGIRSFMLEHVTPILNRFAKQYSDLVTDGEMEIEFHTKDTLKSGKSKERFNIQVSQRHGGGSYASNSSGERARANLVIALALGELASLRADKTIPFRFLDEPFESIDESGTEAIVTLLNHQQKKYNTVYVITHQDHFKQLFPKKLTMVKKNGFSSLEK